MAEARRKLEYIFSTWCGSMSCSPDKGGRDANWHASRTSSTRRSEPTEEKQDDVGHVEKPPQHPRHCLNAAVQIFRILAGRVTAPI